LGTNATVLSDESQPASDLALSVTVDVPVCDPLTDFVIKLRERGARLAFHCKFRISLRSEVTRLPPQSQELGNKFCTLAEIRLQPLDPTKGATDPMNLFISVPFLDRNTIATRFEIGSVNRSVIRKRELKRQHGTNLTVEVILFGFKVTYKFSSSGYVKENAISFLLRNDALDITLNVESVMDRLDSR